MLVAMLEAPSNPHQSGDEQIKSLKPLFISRRGINCGVSSMNRITSVTSSGMLRRRGSACFLLFDSMLQENNITHSPGRGANHGHKTRDAMAPEYPVIHQFTLFFATSIIRAKK